MCTRKIFTIVPIRIQIQHKRSIRKKILKSHHRILRTVSKIQSTDDLPKLYNQHIDNLITDQFKE
jgi:hypothetical protein